MIHVAITIEGVLRKPGTDHVIALGAALYNGLAQECVVALITTEGDEADIRRWLHVERFTRHTHLLPRTVTDPAPSEHTAADCYARQLERLRHQGCPAQVLITADPTAAARVLAKGITAITFTHPEYALPDHRPDYTGARRPWEQLTGELARQRELKATDQRLSDAPL